MRLSSTTISTPSHRATRPTISKSSAASSASGPSVRICGPNAFTRAWPSPFSNGRLLSAVTPSLIGAARENPARKQLEKLLPAFVAAGSGIVIDSFRGESHQQDLVFYERDFCPVYSINDTPEATYFPVEGVIATGEVKSVVDKPTLLDALKKIKSAKLLKRFSQRTQTLGMPEAADYRSFGAGGCFAATPETEFDQGKKFRDQMFVLLICKYFKSKPETVLENLCEAGRINGIEYMPNIIVSLEDGFIQNILLETKTLHHSPLTSSGFAFAPETQRAFTFLVHELRQHAQEGRTVPLSSFDRYMALSNQPLPISIFRPY